MKRQAEKTIQPTEEISGYFLAFTEEEREDIEQLLYDEGYPPGIDGIKQFLLDACKDEPEPKKQGDGIARMSQFILDNPDMVTAPIRAIERMLRRK